LALVRPKRSTQRAVARLASLLNRQEEFVKVQDLVDSGLLVIGRHTYGLPKVWMYHGSESKVVIGAFCSISPGVQIVAGGIHPVNWVSTYPFRAMWGLPGAFQDGTPATNGDIEIGCDVWVGTDAMILSGLRIGDGAIIAARAVVTRDVRPYSIVAGVPAREIGMRFDDEQVAALLRIKWWEWDDEDILAAIPLLSSPDISAFLHRDLRASQ
jgi:chloramphenicol O-acetyltransferase type B